MRRPGASSARSPNNRWRAGADRSISPISRAANGRRRRRSASSAQSRRPTQPPRSSDNRSAGLQSCLVDAMNVKIFGDGAALGRAAAVEAATLIRASVEQRGGARLIAATGASQFAFLDALTAERDVPWTEVELFHLDEYVGLTADHPASFRKFLRERLIEKTGLQRYHFLAGEGDVVAECARVGALLAERPVDVAFVGIGENGHLAFNDPPADFDTEEPYVIVDLDRACRQQQVGEGWFATIDDVPDRAISMS